MNTLDLVQIRIPIELGGRQFHVRRLRVQDILRIVVRFDSQLRAFASEIDPDATKLIDSLDDEDTADLISFAMDPGDASFIRSNLDARKLGQIIILIQSINNVGRIWKSLKMANPYPVKDERSGVEAVTAESQIPDLLRIVDIMAQRYGVTPFEVMDWPYEGFLTLVDVVEDAKKMERDAILQSGIPMPDGSTLDPDLMDDSNISVGPIPDLNPKVH